jgi:uncharacterized protein (DUF1684 family)
MVSIRPPNDWSTWIEAERARKDEFFRKSPDSPLLTTDMKSFPGLTYWAPNPDYYYIGPIHVYRERRQFEIITTAGASRPCETFGWIEFPIDGMPQSLQVYRLLDLQMGETLQGLLLPFADATTGKETYPAGRYVDLGGPDGEIRIVTGPDGHQIATGPFVLDFNLAYNPSCAYGAPERFACPVTPKENRLGVRIEAGERGYTDPGPVPGT